MYHGKTKFCRTLCELYYIAYMFWRYVFPVQLNDQEETVIFLPDMAQCHLFDMDGREKEEERSSLEFWVFPGQAFNGLSI